MTLKKKCLRHWLELGITNPQALREHIAGIFDRHEHQQDILVDLYKLVLPEWEKISKVTGHPQVNEEMWRFICRLFQDFDQKHHTGCMPGGAWMNWGFSVDRELKAWTVDFKNCEVEYGAPEQSQLGGDTVKKDLKGMRVELISTSDPYTTLKPGDRGKVDFLDDLGTVHITWDNGLTLGLVPGEDHFRFVDEPEENTP